MNILIGGGAGYVGSKLVPSLIERGYNVSVIDEFWFGNHLPPETKICKKNLWDINKSDFLDIDQFIFLAGLSNDPMAEFSPAMNFQYNAALPSYLAYMAKQNGVKRFIYASTCSVYGYTMDKLYDETAPTTCGYPYGISKLQGEKGCMQMQDDNFSVIALRKGTVGGYSPRMRYDLIVNTMFKFAIQTNSLMVNNPSIWRPLLDIRDAVSAYTRAIQADYSISGVYNISSGNYTVGEVGDAVKSEIESLRDSKIKVLIGQMQDFRNYKVTCDLARTKLSFHPKYKVEDTIRMNYDQYKSIEEFDYDNNYNIKVFQNMKEKQNV